MSAKRLGMLLIMFTLCVGTAFAQPNRPSAGTDITVSRLFPDDAQHTSIQAAVNAAWPGAVIEILDTATYNEQVTIDGRDTSVWRPPHVAVAVAGNRGSLTIRYIPPGNPAPNAHVARPTIRYRDTQNTSPRNGNEANTPGELPGSSGNFETNGALRIIRARNVTIDGIAVDGGGAFPFAHSGVWGGQWPLFHGNAAIAVVVSGSVTIRNTDLRNAYFGIAVKDRNTGGVFANPNPSDNDIAVPLGGFGRTGNHLFEYNRIHTNSVGVYFESSWDLGSSVRYNLIFNNFHQTGVTRPSAATDMDFIPAAINFKDNYLSPVAIYNNTFHNNDRHLSGGWQIGNQHLVFNNIFGRSNNPIGQSGGGSIHESSNLIAMFPHRMHNCVISAYAELRSEQRYISACTDVTQNPQIHGQQITGITQVRVHNDLPNPARTTPVTVNCLPPIGSMTATTTEFFAPGAPISGGTNAIPASANLRWLQVSGGVAGLPSLFQSEVPTDPRFLHPNWTHPDVVSFIRRQGWQNNIAGGRGSGVGIRNPGSADWVDIGAINESNTRQPIVARVRPSRVVLVNNTRTQATANFVLDVWGGTLTNPRVSFVRWISPLPGVRDVSGPARENIVPSASINVLNNPADALNVNDNNTIRFTVPTVAVGTATNPTYGFFEIVVEGTDAAGRTVTSDVGFLPFRNLEHDLLIEVFAMNDAGRTTPLTEVIAGQQYQLRVTARNTAGATPTPYMDPLTNLEFRLEGTNSVAAGAVMRCHAIMAPSPGVCPPGTPGGPDNRVPLVADQNVPYQRVYTVHFETAGNEIINATGAHSQGTNVRPFNGIAELTVLPGTPDKVSFVWPMSTSLLPPGTNAQTIPRGGWHEVTLEVRDRYNNAVNQQIPVTISVDSPNIGDVSSVSGGPFTSKTATTNANGVATFYATVTNGRQNEEFTMTATITTGTQRTDSGRLRVGRVVDQLLVFYSDNQPGTQWETYYNPDVAIDELAGNWAQVTVKAVSPDTVKTDWAGCIRIDVNPLHAANGLVLATSNTADISTAQSFLTIPTTNGVVQFYVGGDAARMTAGDISNGELQVKAMNAACQVQDHSIIEGSRDRINIRKPESSVGFAVVRGDGNGRPDTIRIRYLITEGDLPMPDSVVLFWPIPANPPTAEVRVVAPASRIFTIDASTIGVNLVGINSGLPAGYTSVTGLTEGKVEIYEGNDRHNGFPVLDGIGPIIAYSGDNRSGFTSPAVIENPTPGPGNPHVVVVQFSEDLRIFPGELENNTTLQVKTGSGPARNLTIQSAEPVGGGVVARYNLTLAYGTEVPLEGDSIRIYPTNTLIKDVAGRTVQGVVHPDNGVHPNNRWVRLGQMEVPPRITSAWYTSSNLGILNYAYVSFDKEIDLIKWFTSGAGNGSFTFTTNLPGIGADAMYGITPGNINNALRVEPDGRTLRIDLSVVHPRSQNRVITAGSMAATIRYAEEKQWNQKNLPFDDRAWPVLVQACNLVRGAKRGDGSFDADTLIVIFSEQIPGGVLSGTPVPVSIFQGATLASSPHLRFVTSAVHEGYYRAVYVVDDPSFDPNIFGAGDSVRIRGGAEVADLAGNLQSEPNSRLVPLVFGRYISINSADRVIPPLDLNTGTAVVVPPAILIGEFTAGPNPVDRQSGSVSFYWNGRTIKGGRLFVYDASGNVVNRVAITGNASNGQARRQIGTWNLTDRRGRPVSEGTYLIRGVLVGVDGKRERVSAMVGVR